MENSWILLLGTFIAAFLGLKMIPSILVISFRKRLFDMPDKRKVHHHPVPRLGGVSFFPVILFALCTSIVVWMVSDYPINELLSYSVAKELLCMIAGLTLLYVIGIADDLIGVRYRQKFLVQIIAAGLFPLAGLYINNLYGLFGIYYITPFIGMPLTVLLVVFLTNAINLIDGIDGLASGLCMVALTIFGIIFLLEGAWMFSLVAFVSLGILIPFFRFNVFGNADRKRKIFMGDTGSLTLGYILSFLVLEFCRYTSDDYATADGSPIVIAFSILLVPCLDVCRVVLSRLRRGANPFLPDKTHIHHKFLDLGFTPTRSLVCILTLSIAFIAITVLAIRFGINANLVFIADIILWIVFHLWLTKLVIKRRGE